jgi:hypothetical protein
MGGGTELEKNRKEATERVPTNGKDHAQKEKKKEEELQGEY